MGSAAKGYWINLSSPKEPDYPLGEESHRALSFPRMKGGGSEGKKRGLQSRCCWGEITPPNTHSCRIRAKGEKREESVRAEWG